MYATQQMLFFCYVGIKALLFVPAPNIHFETRCNAAQFVDLENLIGSLHTYAPDYGHLNVRDTGLTTGQRMLLGKYQNIRIISAKHIQVETMWKVNVTDEFLVINSTLCSRYNQGRHPHIDSIRKRLSLAIVLPFIQDQVNKLIHRLKLDDIYPPCRNQTDSIDLIFYHNKESHSTLDQQIQQFNYKHRCYTNIRYIAASLSAQEDQYPLGSAIMWKKLFIQEQGSNLSLRSYGYTYFFLMEPDVRPIRSYWLDAIVDQITNGHSIQSYRPSKWWMIGSIYRGFEPIEIHFLHINGNALYHLSSSLITFIEQVSVEYPFRSNQSFGYDLDLFSYLLKNMDKGKHLWHKFHFSELIQNCWRTGCNDTGAEFTLNNPNTYLIHGSKFIKNVSQSVAKKAPESTSSNIYPFVLVPAWISLSCYIWKKSKYHRRRFRLGWIFK